jgi:AAA15 family ATPase/GTPase
MFLLFLVLSLIVYLSINYKQYKIAETNRVLLINKEIEEEKVSSEKLKRAPKEIQYLSKKTQQKLQIIKVSVLDIDFTLKEIF